MIELTLEQIKYLHDSLIKETGGLSGIIDEGMLESALKSPFQTYGGLEFYPELCSKIARICVGLIKNHPFIDGNKRVGTLTLLCLLELNQIEIEISDLKLIQIGLDIAKGKMNDIDLAEWLNKNKK